MAKRVVRFARVRTAGAWCAALVIVIAIVYAYIGSGHAAQLNDRSLTLASSAPQVTTQYTVKFTINSNSPVGSIRFLFCSNSPLEEDGCTASSGFDVSAATIASQSGFGVMTIRSQDANEIVVGNDPTAVIPPKTVSFSFDSVVNPTNIGTNYLRISTYFTDNGSGSRIDYGGLAFATTNNVQLTSYVPPYLEFCTGAAIPTTNCSGAQGDHVNLGTLTAAHSSSGTSQMVAATNAGDGYNIRIFGTTLTSGNNVIAALTSPDISRPGTNQFGINLRLNSDPSNGADPSGSGSGTPTAGYDLADRFQFVNGDMVASSAGADNYRKYTTTYLSNISPSQAIGIYASTLTYICTGSF